MSRGQLPPYPYDLALGGHGLLLAYNRGVALYSESEPQEEETLGELALALRDWGQGIGTRRFEGEETLAGYYDSDADAVGGGVDTSYTWPILAPEITSVVVASNQRVSDFAEFKGAFYAAIGTTLYRSSSGSWSDATAVLTLDTAIRSLEVYTGANSPQGLLFIGQENGSYWTYDGTTFRRDSNYGWYSPTTFPGVAPLVGFLLTQDNGTSYTDLTATVTDGVFETYVQLNSIDTIANGDWLEAIFHRPFSFLVFGIPGAAVGTFTVSVEYWNGSGWTAVSNLVDTTKGGGTSLRRSGGALWWDQTMADWASSTVAGKTGYRVRIGFSAMCTMVQIGEVEARWRDDVTATPRTTQPKFFGKTTNGGTSYTDYTSAVTDGSAATAADLSSLPGIDSGGWVVVGSDRPFWGCRVTMGQTNSSNSGGQAIAEYWNGSAWVLLDERFDTTIGADGETSLNRDGEITWARPAGSWPKAPLSNLANIPALHWVRLSWNISLDATTTITEVSLLYDEEARDLVRNGQFLMKVSVDGSRLSWTQDGGYKADWFSATQPIAPRDGSVIGLATAGGVTYLRLTNQLATLSQEGTVVEIGAERLSQPTENDDDEALVEWEDRLYLSAGASFFRFTAPDILESVGPETFAGQEPGLALRITAAAPEGGRFLWCAGRNDQAAQAWLLKFGTLRQRLNPSTGGYEVQRDDAWHKVLKLGDTVITAMRVVRVGGVPYLWCGDRAGRVWKVRLAQGINPLADSGYRYTTVRSYLVEPTFPGRQGERQVVLGRATLNARGLGASGPSVTLQAREPGSSTWTTLWTYTQNGGEQARFPTVYRGWGVDLRLALSTTDATRTPVVDTLTLHSYQSLPGTRLYRLTVLAGDGLLDRRGKRLRRTARDWQRLLERLAEEASLALVTPSGTRDRVVVRAIGASVMAEDSRGNRQVAVPLVLGSV